MPKFAPAKVDIRKKVPVREQTPAERIKNFSEVSLGYNEEEAKKEALRCLKCESPHCIDGCPVGIDIPKFVEQIVNGKYDEAILTIKDKNNLPAVCGRVCPQESQCEKCCILGNKWTPLAIGRLERFAADHETNGVKPEAKVSAGNKVAVIGSGPAGLTAAADLAKMGYHVTVYESLHKAGGVLVYGIPEFRLPKAIVEREVEYIKCFGVEFKLNEIVGKTVTVEDLFKQGFSAIFIGSGAGLPSFMGIPGENLCGVYSANEFLTRVNLMKAYQFPEYDTPIKPVSNVAVVGGGNVAMDAARTAKRLGAEHVYLIYRRGEEEMPARREELEHAKEEGIELKLLMNPTKIIGDDKGWAKSIECICMELGEPDESGRRSPVCKEGSETTLDVDTVIIAIGTAPNPMIVRTTQGLKTGKHGVLEVDGITFMTSIEGVFAGGDAVSGAATVISAMGQAKEAAKAIDEYIRKQATR